MIHCVVCKKNIDLSTDGPITEATPDHFKEERKTYFWTDLASSEEEALKMFLAKHEAVDVEAYRAIDGNPSLEVYVVSGALCTAGSEGSAFYDHGEILKFLPKGAVEVRFEKQDAPVGFVAAQLRPYEG